MLLQNWSTLECWSKLETAADLFQQKYPRSTHLQLAHFFKGIAQQKENRFEEALKTFHSVVTENPKSETGTRARFMFAFTELLSGEPARASVLFSDFIQQHARHELAEEASAWICVSYALAKKHELCLAAAASYKKRYSTGFNRPLVLFQECRAFLATGDYGATIAGFETFLKEFSQHPRAGEARLLLADALTATEKTETALTVLENAPVSDPSSFDEAWFNTHSIRMSVPTIARAAREPTSTILHMGRWKSVPSSMRYQEQSTSVNDHIISIASNPTYFTSEDILLSRTFASRAPRSKTSAQKSTSTVRRF
jgi:TolA-binding protein